MLSNEILINDTMSDNEVSASDAPPRYPLFTVPDVPGFLTSYFIFLCIAYQVISLHVFLQSVNQKSIFKIFRCFFLHIFTWLLSNSLCSGAGYKSQGDIKFCSVSERINRKYRCLGVRILQNGNGIESGLQSLRFWEKVISWMVKWLAHATRDRLILIVGSLNLLGAGISERRFGILG